MSEPQKITVIMQGENGRRFALDHLIDPRSTEAFRGRKITLRIGFASITMPLETLVRLVQTVDAAEKSGSGYPEDWKGFYGLASGDDG